MNPTDNQTPQPVDEIDEILENWYAQSKEQLKARLLQWGTRQVIRELEPFIGLEDDQGWIANRIAELQASLKEWGE